MKTNHTKDEQLIENIAKCIGRAVAPYASKCGEYFSDDEKYAKNVPYTDIKTESKTIAFMFQKLNEEHTKDEKQQVLNKEESLRLLRERGHEQTANNLE